MTQDEKKWNIIETFLKQAKTLTLHAVLQRLIVGSAIIQAAGLTSLAMLVTDSKQLSDDLRAMQQDGLTEETHQLQEKLSELKTNIEVLVNAPKEVTRRCRGDHAG